MYVLLQPLSPAIGDDLRRFKVECPEEYWEVSGVYLHNTPAVLQIDVKRYFEEEFNIIT